METLINNAFGARDTLTSDNVSSELRAALQDVLSGLNSGELRAATVGPAGWQANAWVKKAILLYFKTQKNGLMNRDGVPCFDKVPLKYEGYIQADFEQQGARIVPGALVRVGSHIAKGAILMPSYVNIGAYVGEGTMVDTWATVGSCAQIGAHVHLSGGVGIGGVLEPLQATPTIIEDNCFIGARSEVVEGVIVERHSVLSMGVYIGQSTPIYNRDTKEVFYGRVPSGSVVIPGSLPSADGSYSRYAAIIVKQVDEKTRSKVSINDLLREG